LYTLFTPEIRKVLKLNNYGVNLKTIFLATKVQYRAKSNFRNAIFYNFLNSPYYVIDVYDWCIFFKKYFSYFYGYLLSSLEENIEVFESKCNTFVLLNTVVFFPLNEYKVNSVNKFLFNDLFKTKTTKTTTNINRIMWSYGFDFKEFIKKLKDKKKILLQKILVRYAIIYKNLNVTNFLKPSSNVFIKNLISKINGSTLILMSDEVKTGKKKYYIRFSESTVIKWYDFRFFSKIKLLYIRKAKIFNKSRFSRNRQLYRTGFYWCLWINIIIVYALYFYFYRFSFNFGYLWFLIGLFAFCFFFSRGLQNKFFEIKWLVNEFFCNWRWFESLIELMFSLLTNLNVFVKKQTNSLLYNKLKKEKELVFEFWEWIHRCIIWCSLEWAKKKRKRFVYIWKSYPGIDDSFLKWRSKVFWVMQLWEMLTTY